MSLQVFQGGRILTADGLRQDAVLVVEDGRIREVADRPPPGSRVTRLPEDSVLAPGFIDVQVNGGGGVLFNDHPTAEAALAIAAAHRRYGTTSLLPTLITDRADLMPRAVAAAREAMRQPNGGVAGVHLEGPFISPKRPGVHKASFIRRMSEADATWLRAQGGTLPIMLTVAPEEVANEHLAGLAAAGITLSIGHTAATAERVAQAVALGCKGVTHLYNAMPPLEGRAPGPVGAVLLDRDLWCGIIVDGVHVHATSLRLAALARPEGRTLLVTDAMPVTGSELTEFALYGDVVIFRRNGRLERPDGTLGGADLDMATAVRNTVAMLGLDLGRALRMAAEYPADFMGLADRGRFAPGLRADLVLLDAGLEVVETWVGGVASGG